jgi:uncharacterized glyoxalase superfamily protein PhnB
LISLLAANWRCRRGVCGYPWLFQAQHHQRPRWQAYPCGADVAWHDFDAGPENPALGKRSAKTVGASPAGLFLYVENVDKIVAKAVSLGATAQGQVMDMFWGDSLRSSSGPRGIRVDGGHAQG